jgi:large subunit ribosomal protein L9
VRSGYGRNYLLPRGLAIEATTGNKRMIDEQRRVLAKREQREKVSAQGEAQKLDGLELRFERRVGEHGQLYGSVTSLDIEKALKEKGIEVERRRIALRDHIKEVGDYEVVVKLHREINPAIKVIVRGEGVPEGEEAPAVEAAPPEAPPAEEAQEAAPEQSEAATEDGEQN